MNGIDEPKVCVREGYSDSEGEKLLASIGKYLEENNIKMKNNWGQVQINQRMRYSPVSQND